MQTKPIAKTERERIIFDKDIPRRGKALGKENHETHFNCICACAVRIDIQAGGVLGSEDQILDNLPGGGNVADINRISAFALSQYGCNKASLLGIPYTFENEEHFRTFARSDLAQEFLMEPHEKGLPLRGLCYGEEGFRHFFFKSEVKGINDLK